MTCFWVWQPSIFQIIQWVLKVYHKSRGCRTPSTHGGNIMFYLKHENHLNCGCVHPTMMKCREILVETSLTGAVPLQCLREGRVFQSLSHPAGAGRWIGTHSVTSLFVKPFLNRITEVESSPDLSVMSVCLSSRYVSDAGDSYRCWWPHLWKQCQAGVQHTARTTVFLCGASDRWGKKTEPCPGSIDIYTTTKYRLTAQM